MEHVDLNKAGDIHVELTGIDYDETQIRIGHSGGKPLFRVQVTDSQGTSGEIYEGAREIAIHVVGIDEVQDLAAALRWLADAIEHHSPIQFAEVDPRFFASHPIHQLKEGTP